MIPAAKRACSCDTRAHGPTKLVVLTGGPGAGKTAVLEMLRAALCEHVAVLPEAASILFKGGFPRGTTVPAREAAQRSICFVERQLEELAVREGRYSVVLCDRGTLDSLAYWPGDEASFFAGTTSSRDMELARYAAVIHMRTPADTTGYNHVNPVRIETAAEAALIDTTIVNAWRGHANRHFVDQQAHFFDKVSIAMALIRKELPVCCRGNGVEHHASA